jgi:hypothetical protein
MLNDMLIKAGANLAPVNKTKTRGELAIEARLNRPDPKVGLALAEIFKPLK